MENGNSTQLSLLQLPCLDSFRRSYVSYRNQNNGEQTRGKIFTFLSPIFTTTATESKNLTELPWYQFPRLHNIRIEHEIQIFIFFTFSMFHGTTHKNEQTRLLDHHQHNQTNNNIILKSMNDNYPNHNKERESLQICKPLEKRTEDHDASNTWEAPKWPWSIFLRKATTDL